MVSLMSSNDPKADFRNNKKRPNKTVVSADRPNWFRGALWVPVMNRKG